MKIELLKTEQISEKLKQLILDSDEFYWAVAWGTENSLYKSFINNRKKIIKAVFGTHFYQTDPNLLQHFVADPNVHVMNNDADGTFHPKIYLFIKGENTFAVIGSANFTNGGMNKNDEAASFIEGAINDDFFQQLLKMIDGFWVRGNVITQDFVDNYRLQHEATKKYRNALQKNRKSVTPKAGSVNSKLRFWSWDEYLEKLKSYDVDIYNTRLKVLKECKTLFSKEESFNNLSRNERRIIAGTNKKPESGIDVLLFGSMIPSGIFQKLLKMDSQYLADAIDHIPLIGDVTKEQYDIFVSLYLRAFEKEERTGGLPPASRLLAMKRPDVFLCVNSKNKIGLSEDLGFTPSEISFDKYWYEIIIPITESKWWQSDKPIGVNGLVWEGRVAMLDHIYYKEKTNK